MRVVGTCIIFRSQNHLSKFTRSHYHVVKIILYNKEVCAQNISDAWHLQPMAQCQWYEINGLDGNKTPYRIFASKYWINHYSINYGPRKSISRGNQLRWVANLQGMNYFQHQLRPDNSIGLHVVAMNSC